MEFLLTGTQVYGPTNDKSDLDIVVKRHDAADIIGFLGNHNIKTYRTPGQDEYGAMGGFYFDLAGIKVNIIIAENEVDFQRWKSCTEGMKKFPPIEDRKTRITAFNNQT